MKAGGSIATFVGLGDVLWIEPRQWSLKVLGIVSVLILQEFNYNITIVVINMFIPHPISMHAQTILHSYLQRRGGISHKTLILLFYLQIYPKLLIMIKWTEVTRKQARVFLCA